MISDQPIITEESTFTQKPKTKSSSSEQNFFKLLDGVQEYDIISTKIRKQYQEAMLSLASLKFTDPNSLNLNAHKCVPAFLKVSGKGQLEYGYSGFFNRVEEEEVYFDEAESQEEIEEKCMEKQENLSELKVEKDKQSFCEDQLLDRFSVLNHQQSVLGISTKFKSLIELLLQLKEHKQSFEQNLAKMQNFKQ